MCLEFDIAPAVRWFESDYLKLNAGKCHLIISANKHESLWTDIGNDKIWVPNNVKLSGVSIDRDIKFNERMSLY